MRELALLAFVSGFLVFFGFFFFFHFASSRRPPFRLLVAVFLLLLVFVFFFLFLFFFFLLFFFFFFFFFLFFKFLNSSNGIESPREQTEKRVMIAMAKAARSRDATTASRQHSSLAILFVFFTAWSSVFERGGTVAMAHPPRHSDNILSGGSSNPSEALSRAVSLGKRAQMLRAESAASHVEHRHHHGGQLKGILEGPGSLVRVVYADRLDVELEAMESALVVFADPTSKISRRVDDEVRTAGD